MEALAGGGDGFDSLGEIIARRNHLGHVEPPRRHHANDAWEDRIPAVSLRAEHLPSAHLQSFQVHRDPLRCPTDLNNFATDGDRFLHLRDCLQGCARGFDRDTVYRVVRMVDRNEYKRRQAATGPRVSRRGFGKDRRYPITNGWKPGI